MIDQMHIQQNVRENEIREDNTFHTKKDGVVKYISASHRIISIGGFCVEFSGTGSWHNHMIRTRHRQ